MFRQDKSPRGDVVKLIAGESTDVADCLYAVRRIVLSLMLMTAFILGEWFIIWLIGITIMGGHTNLFANPPFSLVKTLSFWVVAGFWFTHVLAEIVFWIIRHLRIGISNRKNS